MSKKTLNILKGYSGAINPLPQSKPVNPVKEAEIIRIVYYGAGDGWHEYGWETHVLVLIEGKVRSFLAPFSFHKNGYRPGDKITVDTQDVELSSTLSWYGMTAQDFERAVYFEPYGEKERIYWLGDQSYQPQYLLSDENWSVGPIFPTYEEAHEAMNRATTLHKEGGDPLFVVFGTPDPIPVDFWTKE